MVTQYNSAAAAAGSASVSEDRRGWTNVPAQRQEKVTVVISDRKEKGGHNVPPERTNQND
jgi:hypothetical protein